jgi:predicted dienelactone hydrolase
MTSLQRFEWHDAVRRRPVSCDVWFPAAGGAPVPLVVMSHGAGGAPVNYAWLAEYLARSGVIVLGVAHYGDSWQYGAETMDPAAAARLWLRPGDCTFALTQLLESGAFRDRIDTARIGALGHSSGGATAVALAGAALDSAALVEYCRSDAGERDRGCGYARTSGVQEAIPDEAIRNSRDSRIAAAVVLDPAAGPGYSAASLGEVRIPVLVVGSRDNDFLPFEAHADHFGRLIPNATVLTLDRGEGHFVYLNDGKDDIAVHGVPLYRDRPGVDRKAVHARLAPEILSFFRTAM